MKNFIINLLTTVAGNIIFYLKFGTFDMNLYWQLYFHKENFILFFILFSHMHKLNDGMSINWSQADIGILP